jgi:tetratricopeptide (TPR) repeat protein
MGYYLRGTKNRALGKLDKALDDYFKSAAIASKLKHTTAEGESYAAIGDTYSGNNHQNAMEYYYKGIALLRQAKASTSLASALSNTGDEFFKVKKYDSALLYFSEARIIFEKLNHQSGIGYSLGNTGMVYASIGQTNLAEKNINEAIRILEEAQDYYPICDYLLSMADIYSNKKDDQSALNYALRSLQLGQQYGLKEQVANASLKLSGIYERTRDIASSFLYYKKHIATRDSINNLLTVQKMADLRTKHEVSQKQIEVNLLNQQKRNEKNLTVSLSIILGLAVIILAILLRNNQNKQNAYKILNQQKKQTDEQKAKAEDALVELQVTQKQLIQSAKNQ